MFARATVDGKGGEVEGKGEANGDGGSVSQGSAREVVESVENKAVAGTRSTPPPFTVRALVFSLSRFRSCLPGC
jgi:hypothetical protein